MYITDQNGYALNINQREVYISENPACTERARTILGMLSELKVPMKAAVAAETMVVDGMNIYHIDIDTPISLIDYQSAQCLLEVDWDQLLFDDAPPEESLRRVLLSTMDHIKHDVPGFRGLRYELGVRTPA